MTNLSLKERLARLEPFQAVVPAVSGSPGNVTLSADRSRDSLAPIPAVFELRRVHVPAPIAKRAIEEALETGRAVLVHCPVIDEFDRLQSALRSSGFEARLAGDDDTDLAQLRARLALTQDEFAARFGFEVDAIRNWEQGRRKPDRAARSYLAVINRAPEMVAAVFAGHPATTGLTDDRKVDAS
jgi:putative transcriptional regulator